MNNKHIPTMPQPSQCEHVPTMPQENNRISSNKTLILDYDIEFFGEKGGNFIIISLDVISNSSGESQIYKCYRRTDRTTSYVARILTSITPSSKAENRIARNKIISFLKSVSNNPDSHILPLIDCDTISINLKEYYVEVYPFCEEGNLSRRKGRISNNEMKNNIIPAINEALNCIHSAGFVHGDILNM